MDVYLRNNMQIKRKSNKLEKLEKNIVEYKTMTNKTQKYAMRLIFVILDLNWLVSIARKIKKKYETHIKSMF